MKRHVYRERDYAFAQLVLTLRTAIGLRQLGLAERLGASRRAPLSPVPLSPPAGTPGTHAAGEPAASPRVNLVEALDVSHFAGREVEVAELSEWIVQERCRLVTLLSSGDPEGSYLEGYEGYGRLIGRLAESAHQSCVLLTSRERPREIEALEGTRSPVRSLRLSGLDDQTAQELLADKGLSGTPAAWQGLVAGYAGNPLALKIVAQAITDLFGGDLDRFLQEGELIFKGIRPLRRQQASFGLQSMVMEYLTDELGERLAQEIMLGNPLQLRHFALALAHAKDYVRQTQVRLLVFPLLERLHAKLGADAQVEAHLLRLLAQFRA